MGCRLFGPSVGWKTTQVETQAGLFIAEGAKVIRRALAAGYAPRSFLLAERWLAGLADLLAGVDVPVYVVSLNFARRAGDRAADGAFIITVLRGDYKYSKRLAKNKSPKFISLAF